MIKSPYCNVISFEKHYSIICFYTLTAKSKNELVCHFEQNQVEMKFVSGVAVKAVNFPEKFALAVKRLRTNIGPWRLRNRSVWL